MPVNHEKALAQFERYVHARDNGHLQFVEKADLCDRYFCGDQWDPATKARLGTRPSLTLNELQALLVTAQGEMVEERIDVTFRPVKAFGGSDAAELHAETAQALSAVYVNVMQRNDMEWVEGEAVDDALVTSRGWLDLRIEFDEELQGEIVVDVLNPRDVVLDPDARHYDPDKWNSLFITRWLSLDELEVEWGPAVARHFKGRSQSAFEGVEGHDSFERTPAGSFGGTRRDALQPDEDQPARVRLIERQYRKAISVPHFVDPATGSSRMVPPAWDDARTERAAGESGLLVVQRKASVLHTTVTADDWVLQDGPSIYRHFTPVPFFPLLRNGKTIGMAEGLISPQDLLNKSMSSELHVVNGTANSGWKTREGNIVNMSPEELEQRGADTGLALVVEEMDGTEKIAPNQIPGGLDRLSFKAEQMMKELSGVSDSRRGLDRADVSGKAIVQKRAAGSVTMARIHSNLARTRRLIARRVLDLVQSFYTEPRVMQVRGDGAGSLQAEDTEVSVNTHDEAAGRVVNDLTLGVYDAVIVQIPPRDVVEDTEFLESVELRKLGIPIPDDEIVAASHLRNKAAIARRLSGEESAKQQQAVEQAELGKLQAETQKLESEAKENETQAALNVVRARAEAMEAEFGGQGPDKGAEAAQEQQTRRELHVQKLGQNDADFAQKMQQRQALGEAQTKAAARPKPRAA